MIGQLMASLDGRKTYIFLLAWFGYKLSVQHAWIQPMPELESSLLLGAGLSGREAIGKNKKI